MSSQFLLGIVFVFIAAYAFSNYSFDNFSEASRNKNSLTYTVYGDSLASGWKEFSSANVDIKERRPTYKGSRSISFITQNSKAQLYFYSKNSFDLEKYDTLWIAVRATKNNQEYGIYLVDDNEKPITDLVPFSSVGPELKKNKWVNYSIPLDLLLEDDQHTRGIVIKGIEQFKSKKIYIDQIKFTGSSDDSESEATPKPTAEPTPQPTPAVTPEVTPAPTSQPTTSWWQPTPDEPIHWHWQLSQDFEYPRDVVKNVTVYDIDGEYATKELVTQLKNSGPNVKVICYIDAGVYETYRSDADKFPDSVIGSKDVGWDGSYWLDIRQQDIILPIMKERMQKWCKDKGFDAIEPDETEVWSNNPGFPITKAQNNSYNIKLAEMAHEMGLSIGLKGNTTETDELWPYFDWTLNEECWQYNECKILKTSFIDHGKAVFNIEYKANPNCDQANAWHMNSAKRDLNLVGPSHKSYLYQPCVADNVNTW